MRPLLICLLFLLTGADAVAQVKPGAERIFEQSYFQHIRDKRVGLITNATGVDSLLRPNYERLAEKAEVRLTALFAPEHGLAGAAQAGETVASDRRVYSLYGEVNAPTDAMLQDVDVLIYDIQDVGARFYTYISTMLESMKAASRRGIPFIVLDRPSPIDGNRVEGPVLQAGFESFVGIYRLPVRYGMTPGELARLFNEELNLGCRLLVVPMSGWKRSSWYDQTGLPWVMPSPNMPTLETAAVYPGFCLFEGTNLSEGRGTTRPFELIGAPWLNAPELAERLNRVRLPGVLFRSQAYTPWFSKYQGELCQGVQVHVINRNTFDPVRSALHFMHETALLHPDKLTFNASSFDRLAGNSWIREALQAGKIVDDIVQNWERDLREFKKKRAGYLLY
jgi:uncharacterized protein YbbC (DUF1343 family)